ncbi:ABC transporter ATP-binding protein [Halosquirtibacter xylanolyticus]|uniref:ABC transporter ATP-binding protein n=1 Tax=Halosquirtibacter xylanolyticus TaxID=3374599 RepID=UPI00374896AC|nr:ABC transporter ATP-binding protein [Prolixibacteraceae bacterium]
MKTIIEIKDLIKDYHMGSSNVRALDHVSLSISEGEYVSFMGPSGSGKTTLMNIIGCLDLPTDGSYHLNGKSIFNIEADEMAAIRNNEIGFVFQSFNLLPRSSALENVALPLVYAGVAKEARLEKAYQSLERVGLGNRVDHKPSELSGGQQQRVAIARALVNNPSLILADEPTGALDTKTSYEIMDLFEELHLKGHSIVMVTHEEEIAEYAKRVIRMRDGYIEKDTLNNQQE